VESAHDAERLGGAGSDLTRGVRLIAEGSAIEHRDGAVRGNAGPERDAEAVHPVRRPEQRGEVGQVHADPARLEGNFGRIGARLVHGRDGGDDAERVRCGAEADGVADGEVELGGQPALDRYSRWTGSSLQSRRNGEGKEPAHASN
jgi:hypothetical protein